MPQSEEPRERPPLTDEVELFFQRLGLGEAEAAEIEDQTGVGPEDLRPALKYLEEEKVIEGTDAGWRLKDGDAAPPPRPDEEGDPADGDGDPDLMALTEEPGPALNAHVRARMGLTCSFGRKPGESDDANVLKAQLLAEEFGNAVAAAFPKLDLHIELLGVDSFDNPRPLFPLPDDQP